MFKHGFPPEWSTLKKLIWLVGSGIAGAASGIWKTVTGTLIHITDALASPVKELSVAIEPQQSGSGDPSPTNVRPITGWTGCEVTRAGKNFIGEENLSVISNQFYIWGGVSSSDPKADGSFWLEAGTYTISCKSGIAVAAWIEDKSGTLLASNTGFTSFTFSILQTQPIKLSMSRRNGGQGFSFADEPQLELGSTATDYEPYNGTTLSVTFTDSAGTVYGGTLDLVSGELTVKTAVDTVTRTSTLLQYSASTKIIYITTKSLHPTWATAAIKCSHYKGSTPRPYIASGNSNTNVWLYITDEQAQSETVVEDFKDWLDEQENNGTPLQIQYKLSTPLTYQLTPQEISTLKGENNVWSNTNSDTTIIYKAQAE